MHSQKHKILSSLLILISLLTYTHMQSPSLDLSPSEDEEWVALQEHLAEEEQEGRELESRRKEIRDRTQEQSAEIEQLKKGNAEQQAKVSRQYIKPDYNNNILSLCNYMIFKLLMPQFHYEVFACVCHSYA